ncbi:hypothetical protein AB0N87_07540 [Streptomyces sp. NPDC093228]|uniref:hypothetical protein n=1 Tax=Streptomyces sp. NPDC093228 TaxID=3155070 RepID=UPI0034215E0C
MRGLRGVTVTALMGGILMLTGCHGSPGTDAASGAPSPTSPSATSSASSPDAPATAAAPSGAASSAAPRPSSTSTPARATASTGAARMPASVPGCRNLSVGHDVKAAVASAYRRAFPRLVHIRPEPHRFFYGQCGAVRYAATRFQATPGVTDEELVNMQDEGSTTKYFRGTSGGGWTYLTSDGLPAGPHGCGDIPEIPAALAKAWGNCSAGR